MFATIILIISIALVMALAYASYALLSKTAAPKGVQGWTFKPVNA